MISEQDLTILMDRINNYSKFMCASLNILKSVNPHLITQEDLYNFCEGLVYECDLVNKDAIKVLSSIWKEKINE